MKLEMFFSTFTFLALEMETPPEPGNQRPGSRNKGKLELPHRFYIKGVENRDKDLSSIVHLPGLQAKQLPASLGKPGKKTTFENKVKWIRR